MNAGCARVLACCALVGLWASVGAGRVQAQADDINPTPPSEVEAPFTFIVNHAKQGEITILLRDDDIYVKRSDLEAAGIHVPDGREIEHGDQKLLSLKSISPPLTYVLDEAEIVLKIDAPTNLLPRTSLDVAGRPPQVEYQTRPSAFFNYVPRVNDFGQIDMYDELGASVGGNLLFTSAYLSNHTRPHRGVSNFVINDRKHLQRTTVGDALVTTGPLGSGHFVGGMTIAKAYGLDPYVVKAPSLGYQGATMTPSTLDVYVNGVRVRSEELPPGTFQLSNLRVGGGSGVATYVIRDVFGHEQSVTVPFYVADSVLAKGFQEYTYSAGALRDRVGTESWDYGRAVVLGKHRIGVSDSVTLGARAEASEPTISGGPSVTMLTPIGQIELEVGASRDVRAATGFAGFVSYSYVGRTFGAGVFGHAQTDRYANVDMRAKDDRATLEVGVFQSTPIGPRVTCSAQGMLSRYRDRGTGLRGALQLSLRLGNRATLFGSAGKLLDENGGTSWDALLTLNYSFEGGHNASASGRLTNGDPSLLVDAGKSVPVGSGYGYRVQSTLAEDRQSVSALAQYQTLFGRYSLDYGYLDSEHHATAEAAGAIVVVPGVGLFPTLPVQDGFGVIRVAGVRDVRGYVNNQEIGRTDRNGNLLVPNLLSYYGNRLSIAAEDVPIQYSFDDIELTLAPPSRGVAVADFELRIPHFYRGRMVVDEHGTRVVPKFGQIRLPGQAGEELISPLGELGEFEIDGAVPGKRMLSVDYVNGTCLLEYDVPDSDETVIEVGELTCKVP